ncbi:MAG: hypothetical protein ACO3XO_04555 [Bdellovibrionota bacterium]
MISLPVSRNEPFLTPYDDGRASVTVAFDRSTKQIAFIPESLDPFDLAEAGFGEPDIGLSDGDALEEVIREKSESARRAGWTVVSTDKIESSWERNSPHS